jgi:hydrogenase small subunit
MEDEAKKGLSRREFLTWAGVFAASFGIAGTSLTKIAQALEEKLAIHPVIWIAGGSCTGCSVSLLNSVDPDIKKILLEPVVPGHQLSVVFHPTVMAASGDQAISAIEKTHAEKKGQYVLVVEGAVPTAADGAYCDFGMKNGKPVTMVEWMKDLGADCLAVLSVGTCSSYGGIPTGKPAPTGSVSVTEFFKSAGISKPVLNIPGCPPHPDWIVLSIAQILLNGLPTAADVDGDGRLKKIYGTSVHDQCPRRTFFDEGTFAEKFGDPGCLIELGCKGPQAMADCPTRLWNNKNNFCIGAGSPCIACCEPGFPDASSPFYAMLNEDNMLRYGVLDKYREVKRNA